MLIRLHEFEVLLNRRYPAYQAGYFLRIITFMAIMGDHEAFLNKVLACLRGEEDTTADLLDPTLLQQSSAMTVDQQRLSPERYLQGKTKLVAIEQLLSAHYPKEFVESSIRTLSSEFDVSGNLSALDEAFERHRSNVERDIRY
jgi:hypothetical protein